MGSAAWIPSNELPRVSFPCWNTRCRSKKKLQHSKRTSSLVFSRERSIGGNATGNTRAGKTIFPAEVWGGGGQSSSLRQTLSQIKNHNWAKYDRDKPAQRFSSASAAVRQLELLTLQKISRRKCRPQAPKWRVRRPAGDGVPSAPTQNQEQSTRHPSV